MPDEYKIMTWKRGGVVQQQHIPCTLFNVSVPIEMMAQGGIPVDVFDLYSDWPIALQRSDYLIDEVTGTQYSVYGKPAVYTGHLECRVTVPTGAIP